MPSRMLMRVSKEEWAKLPDIKGEPTTFAIADDLTILLWPKPKGPVRFDIVDISVLCETREEIMSKDKIFSVYVQRKSVVAQVQLNFTAFERANQAFATLAALEGRKILSDDFGAKVSFDPSDIGHVLMVDAEKSFEFQTEIAVLQHDAQVRAQQKAGSRPRIDLAPGARLNG